VPTISGMLFDKYGMVGVFGLAAFMYAVFVLCIQMGPETYGRSMEDISQPASTETDIAPVSGEAVKA
jgi:putative MFS transporter